MSVDYPLVTVIVSTHNRPELLKKTLSSILQQSYPNFELLVVSNGWSDENRRISIDLGDTRIRYIEQENSGGPAAPRNNGIRQAKGKYVAFCDDDDLWMPEKLEKQVQALENHVDHGLCYSKMLRFNDQKSWSVTHEEGPANLHSLLYINTVPISSVLIKTALLTQYGGFSESKHVGSAEDYEFLLRYASLTNFYFINEYLIKYWSGNDRITDNQMSVGKLCRYISQIFYCYGCLVKSKKIKLKKLFSPALYNIRIFIKGCMYQMLQKIKVVQ